MRRLKFIIMALAMTLTSCTYTRQRTGHRITEHASMDSTVRERRSHQHEYTWMVSPSIRMYKIHDPDCRVCREMRRQETMAIIDSVLRAHGLAEPTD